MAKVGAPTKYNQELVTAICEQISTTHKGLRTICKELNINVSSVLNWLNDKDKPEFLVQYTRAKEEQADLLTEQMIEIADDGTNDTIQIEGKNGKLVDVEDKEWTNRSRLRVETRKWIASKLKPKKYGDKLDLTTGGEKLNIPILSFDPLLDKNE
jgi:hypothetical protein